MRGWYGCYRVRDRKVPGEDARIFAVQKHEAAGMSPGDSQAGRAGRAGKASARQQNLEYEDGHRGTYMLRGAEIQQP